MHTNTIKEKKDEYLERVLNVEKATFTPAVFLTSGGMSKECKRFVNRVERYCGSIQIARPVREQLFARTVVRANSCYSITSLVRASLVRGPSVVRGFEWLNFSSHYT